MKKTLIFLYLFCATLTLQAQDLIHKIPKEAKAVIALKGKNLTDLVSITEFENSKMGQLFLKNLKKETGGKIVDLKTLGVNLESSFYYFMESDSLGFKHNFLAPLKTKIGFEALLSNREKEKIKTDGKVSYFIDKYDDMVTMWTDNILLVTFLQPNKESSKFSYNYNEDVTTQVAEAAAVAVKEAKSTYPIMSFTNSTHDFGNIIDGDVVEHSFRFTNTGNADLLITKARASCGCTVPNYPKNAIKPGETGQIDVKFNSSNKSGKQTKSITLTANTKSGTERLTIKTNIYPQGTKRADIIKETEEVIEIIEVAEDEIEETVIESVEDTSEVMPPAPPVIKRQETPKKLSYYEKRRLEREARKKLTDKYVTAYAKNIISGTPNNGSILKNSAYVKTIGKGKDEATAWLGDVSNIYKDIMQQASYGLSRKDLALFSAVENMYSGMSLSSKLNFEDNVVKLSTSYTMNDEMAKYSQAMYNGKMNSNFFNYFNEDKMLGYFAVNASIKGILEAYPDLISNMFKNSTDKELATLAPLGMEVFSLLLDEEGAAEILRGDVLFVLTELKEKEVTYTTYEYDENYKRKSVEKTKTETLPDFMFMATTNKGKLFRKFMDIGVRESRGEVTLSADGIYQIKAKELPYTINATFKDNTVIIGSSLEHLTAIKKGNFKPNVGKMHKNLITKNSSVIYVNGKQIATNVPRDVLPRELKDKMDYISKNTEDVIFRTSKIKNNTLNGEMILNTPEKGHKNSLAYFFNLIDMLID